MAATNSTGKDHGTGSGVAWDSLNYHLPHYLSVSMEKTRLPPGRLFLTHHSSHCVINCPWSCSQQPQRWVLSFAILNAYYILTPATAKEWLGGLCFDLDGHLYIYYNALGLETKTSIFLRGLKQKLIQWKGASLATPRQQRTELKQGAGWYTVLLPQFFCSSWRCGQIFPL